MTIHHRSQIYTSFFFLSVYLFVCIFIYLFFQCFLIDCLSVCLSDCLTDWLTDWLTVCTEQIFVLCLHAIERFRISRLLYGNEYHWMLMYRNYRKLRAPKKKLFKSLICVHTSVQQRIFHTSNVYYKLVWPHIIILNNSLFQRT